MSHRVTLHQALQSLLDCLWTSQCRCPRWWMLSRATVIHQLLKVSIFNRLPPSIASRPLFACWQQSFNVTTQRVHQVTPAGTEKPCKLTDLAGVTHKKEHNCDCLRMWAILFLFLNISSSFQNTFIVVAYKVIYICKINVCPHSSDQKLRLFFSSTHNSCTLLILRGTWFEAQQNKQYVISLYLFNRFWSTC